MNNIYKKVKAFYLRNKVSDFEYDCVREELYTTNLAVVSVCSLVVLILFFLLGFVSLFIPKNPVLKPPYMYLVVFILSSAIFFASRKITEDKHKWSVFLFYAFIWIIDIYTGTMGIYRNTQNYSIMFVVFEFAYPILFVDKIKRIYINSAIAGFIFSVCTFIFKPLPIAMVDIFYVWIFYGLSYFPSFFLAKIRVREFSLRQIIESERDTDELTGLLNKSAFTREAKKSINSTKEGILIIMDLDYFKQVNDTYGHFVGDHVLKLVSNCMRQIFRSSDVMGRFGGDEFVMLMSKTTRTDIAQLRCEQLLKLLNETRIFPDDPSNKITIHASIGFALFEGESDFDSLFQKSDKALYEAKNTGKDKVCQYK